MIYFLGRLRRWISPPSVRRLSCMHCYSFLNERSLHCIWFHCGSNMTPVSLMERTAELLSTRTPPPKKMKLTYSWKERFAFKGSIRSSARNLEKPWKIKLSVMSSGAFSSKQNGAYVWKGDHPLLSLNPLLQIFSRQAISFHSVARWITIKIIIKLNILIEQLNCTTIF